MATWVASLSHRRSHGAVRKPQGHGRRGRECQTLARWLRPHWVPVLFTVFRESANLITWGIYNVSP